MSLLLFTALLGYQLAGLVRLPAVVGAVLGGLLLGPSLLDLITYNEFVASVAHMGAIILLFIVGLEINIKMAARWEYVVIAFFGVALPWIGGYGVAVLFGIESAKAVVIGVAMTATSVALTAETFREAGVLKAPVAQAVIASAIIDDVLALTAVGMIPGGAGGAIVWSSVGWSFVKAVGFLVIAVVVGRRLVSRLLMRVDRSDFGARLPEVTFVFAMMTAFLFALLAELAGLSAIVGAFVAGLALEGTPTRRKHHLEEGAEYLRAVFGATFFVALGALADFSGYSWEAAGFAAALTLGAVASKIIGCGLPALAFGYSRRDSLAIGLGMTPRGEVAMIIGLLALTSGVIAQPTFLAIVTVAIVTSIVIPPLLRLVVRP